MDEEKMAGKQLSNDEANAPLNDHQPKTKRWRKDEKVGGIETEERDTTRSGKRERKLAVDAILHERGTPLFIPIPRRVG